nr:MAG TPA: hypothetical protein [Caudoviricetes sp.]
MLIIYFYFPTVHNGRWVFKKLLKKKITYKNVYYCFFCFK